MWSPIVAVFVQQVTPRPRSPNTADTLGEPNPADRRGKFPRGRGKRPKIIKTGKYRGNSPPERREIRRDTMTSETRCSDSFNTALGTEERP
ncbi:unnamed protein product, partial [Nesidiocoris tenuis]